MSQKPAPSPPPKSMPTKPATLTQYSSLENQTPELVTAIFDDLHNTQIQLAQQNESLRELQQEQELTQQRYASLFADAPVPYITLKANGTILLANTLASQLFGVAQQMLQNRLILPRIHHDARGDFVTHVQQTLETNTRQTCHIKMLRDSGETFTAAIASHAIRIGFDQPATLGMVIRDITEEEAAITTLRESELRAHSLLNQATVGIIHLNTGGDIKNFNPHAQTMLGNIDLETTHISELWLDKLLANQRSLQHPGATGVPLPSRLEWHTYFVEHQEWSGFLRPAYNSDGQRLYHVTFQALPTTPGRHPNMQVVMHDVTHLTQVQAQKDEFTSIISHELRTPLTSLIGSLKLLRSGLLTDINERAEQMLDIGQRNADRLLFLINDILDIGKLEAGGLELHLQTTQLSLLIHKSLEDSREYADAYNVSWQFIDSHPNACATIDPERFQQVITNLLSNAAKFSGQTNKVVIKVHQANNKLHIQFWDWGEGVQPSFQPFLFKKFAQHDTLISRKNKGTGLGLYISKYLIEAMKGQLSFEPNPEGGSIFSIIIPETFPDNI